MVASKALTIEYDNVRTVAAFLPAMKDKKDSGEQGAEQTLKKETPTRFITMKPTRQMESKPLSHEPFMGKYANEYNAFRSALRTAAENCGYKGEYAEYEWLDKAARTSMTLNLVDALHEHGYEITRRSMTQRNCDSSGALDATPVNQDGFEGEEKIHGK